MNFTIPKKLSDEIEGYCKANKIDDVQDFILKIVKKGFDLEKWGDLNFVKEPPAPSTAINTIQADPNPKIFQKHQEITNKSTQTKKTQPSEQQLIEDIYGDE